MALSRTGIATEPASSSFAAGAANASTVLGLGLCGNRERGPLGSAVGRVQLSQK